MNDIIQDIAIRGITHREYRAFTMQIVDKGQLGFPLTISLLLNGTLIAVKYNFGQNDFEKLKENYLNQENVEVVSIDEFNRESSKVKNKVQINKKYYEGKNFVITNVQL